MKNPTRGKEKQETAQDILWPVVIAVPFMVIAAVAFALALEHPEVYGENRDKAILIFAGGMAILTGVSAVQIARFIRWVFHKKNTPTDI
jgi:prolipoprotein diacylglyceryltransferase